MSVTIRLLGPVEVEVDGEPLHVDTKKAVALLAYLAGSGRSHDREHLVDLLWPGYDQERGRATLRRTLSALRSGLGEGRLEVDRTKVALVLEGVDVDIHRLHELDRLHPHDPGESCDECLTTLKEIVSVHRGDFMQGFVIKEAPGYEEWQLAQQERVRRDLGLAFDRLLDSSIALDRFEEAERIAEQRIALDPLNEPTYRTLMRIHSAKGERGAVVATYRSLVAALDRELGVEPLDESTDLYLALSRGAAPSPQRELIAPSAGSDPLPFVGRASEWERLVGDYQRSDSMIVGIHGEAGIGKTRLVEEFISHARALGARTVIARAHEGEAHVAYGVLTEALQELVTSRVAGQLSEASLEELARLLPELDVDPAESPVANRFYEAVRAAFEEGLRGDRPGVVVFEDVHWADDATLDALAYVARRVAETGICLICTWRTEERYADLLQQIVTSEAAMRIELVRFGQEELAALIIEAKLTLDEDQTTRLLDETEGVPYFVTEYVKSLSTAGTWQVPASVRDLVAHKLTVAHGVARQILDAAAVIDRAVHFELVCRVSGRTDLETADALDELSRTGLMRVTDEGVARYEFSHDKLRAVAYEQLSPARKHVLHRRTAEALIESAPDPDGASAASIARHLELAGTNETAADYHRKAGLWAHRVFAHAEALEHFRRALALSDANAEIHESIADVHVLQGNYAEAVTSYETAAALAEEPGSIDRKLGALYLRRGEYDLAQAHLNDALETSKDEWTTTEILVDLSLVARRLGTDEEAATYAAEAVRRATALGDSALTARAENAAGMLASAAGDAEGARGHLQVAFDLATVADDLPAMVAALNNLALVERRAERNEEAIELTRQALEACRRLGDRHREAALENNLADLFNDIGDRAAAMDHLKRATAIFAEVGSDPHGPLPEVWKLVEW